MMVLVTRATGVFGAHLVHHFVRELLRAAMPVPQLPMQEAAAMVVEHLVNRTHSHRSRLRKQRGRVPEI